MAQNSNPIAGLHKQKMYTLILAGVGLISLILPWVSAKVKGFGSIGGASHNGFGSWGIMVLIGVGVAVASCFMGDKTQAYDENTKKIALAGFGAMAGGALIYLIRILTSGGGAFGVSLSPGIGLFLGLAAGALGLLLLLGIVKPPKSIDDKVDNLS